MNRMMRAEIYRLCHGGHILRYSILASVVMILMVWVNALGLMDAPVAVHMSEEGDFASILLLMFVMLIPFLVAMVPGTMYDKGKLGYYEVMAGESIHGRIWSKVLTDGLIYTVLTVFSVCIFFVVMGVKNGLGGYDHVLARVLLFAVVTMHVVVDSVMIVLCFRTMLAAGVAFMRFTLVDEVFLFVAWLGTEVLDLNEKVVRQIYLLMVQNQLLSIVSEQIDASLVFHVIIGFLVEFALWYVFCYIGMKKRLYQ